MTHSTSALQPFSMLTSLVPVIVGGVIALAGSIVGPAFLHRAKESAERKRRRAEKFEELVTILFEHDHWLDVLKNTRVFLKNTRVFGYPDEQIPSPLAKALAISAIYFPQFDLLLTELEMCAKRYEVWMCEAAQRRLASNIAAINEGFLEVQALS